jgi:carboxymethylenebutenolidase
MSEVSSHYVSYPSHGEGGRGYLARPAVGGPGVIIIQEWWGLVPHIEHVADRFAAEGFVALAPDLYRGEFTREPDEAARLMMALNLDRASADMSGAIDYLTAESGHPGVGVVGFCMGGGLALKLACDRPDAVRAVAPFYGVIPWPAVQPDFSAMTAAVEGHYAENDESAPPATVAALEEQLVGLGKSAVMYVYPGTQHAFFNDTRPEVYDKAASTLAFARTIAHLRTHLV